MALILDTNCFANVFSPKSEKHKEFKPVYNWIIYGKGILVYGGSKYKTELKKAVKYLHIFNLLKKVGKTYEGNNTNIDRLMNEVSSKIRNNNFDDPHLPAIVMDTKCIIICSEDHASIPFVTNPILYPNGFEKPKYYTGLRCVNLLSEKYVNDCLKPLCKMNKEQQLLFEKL